MKICYWKGDNMKINSNEITSNANTIIKNVEEFDNEIKKLNNVIDKINVSWSGSDSLKYINAMKLSYLPQLKKHSNEIMRYGNYLKSVPSKYDKVDEMFSSKEIDI